MEDPIVEEVRRIREEHAAKFNFDVDAIYDDMKRRELESGQPRVSFGPRGRENQVRSALTVSDTAIK